MEEALQTICANSARNEFSGVCYVKRGEEILVSCAYGMAHKGFSVPNTLDMKFDTASVTKVFTATAVLLLIESGKLAFEDKIVELLDLKGTEIPLDVTIEHLLTHTSGIADDADEEAGEKYSDLFITKPNYSIRNAADFLPQFVHKKPLFKAGTGVRYNNCAFILLGLVIEKLGGSDYRSFVKDSILGPCGLKNTVFCAKDDVNVNIAEGYIRFTDDEGKSIKWKKNIYSYPPIGTPDAGIYSTVEDLDLFVRLLKDGKILSCQYTELILHPHCSYTRPVKSDAFPSPVIRTGYGFEFVESNGEIVCMRKDGINNGVGAILAYYPESDLTIVILANQDCNIWDMHRRLERAIHEAYPPLSESKLS